MSDSNWQIEIDEVSAGVFLAKAQQVVIMTRTASLDSTTNTKMYPAAFAK